ncbi:MAG: hypothetical protein GEU80_14850 [Dehalococcoidia bacterium]|nr:hypothetical protein [Dehalococcoidia bacterium]
MTADLRPLPVALLQLRAHALSDHEAAWGDLLRRIDEAAAHQPRLILAPEAAYPASVLAGPDGLRDLRGEDEVIGALGDAARRHACYLVAGVLLARADGVESAVVVLGPDGREVARASRAQPARSETHWLRPGDGPALFDLDGFRVGVLAGGDLHAPQPVEGLAAIGVDLLLVAGGDAAPTPSMPPDDVAHIAPTRAIEAGAWLLRAAKSGPEGAALMHAGRSGVVDPYGRWAVQAPAGEPGLVVHTLDLGGRATPPVEGRPEVFGEWSADSPGAPDLGVTGDASGAPPAAVVAAITADPSPSAVDLMEGARRLVAAAAARGARLIVLPDFAGNDARAVTQQEFLPLFEALSLEHRATLAVGLAERAEGATYKTVYLVERGGVLASHRQTLLTPAELAAGFAAGHLPGTAVESAAGRIGLLAGAEGLAAAPAAAVARARPSLLAWCAGALGGAGGRLDVLARTRALETGVTVAAAGDLDAGGGACIAGPGGAVLASSATGEPSVAIAEWGRASVARGTPQPVAGASSGSV